MASPDEVVMQLLLAVKQTPAFKEWLRYKEQTDKRPTDDQIRVLIAAIGKYPELSGITKALRWVLGEGPRPVDLCHDAGPDYYRWKEI